MLINITELRNNLSKYLFLAAKEDIFVIKNGKIVCKMTKPFVEKEAMVEELCGILSDTLSLKEAKEKHLKLI